MSKDYHAYLLRLERNQDEERWRILLESVNSGRVRVFTSKRELLLFILALFDEPPSNSRASPPATPFAPD